jgi:hypothetical protein
MEPLQINETEWVVLFGADRYSTKEACEQAIEQMEEGKKSYRLETHWHLGTRDEEKKSRGA